MTRLDYTVARPAESALATNRLIKNTYMLLSLTLLFSALTAGISMVFSLPHPGILITLVGFYLLTSDPDDCYGWHWRYFPWPVWLCADNPQGL